MIYHRIASSFRTIVSTTPGSNGNSIFFLFSKCILVDIDVWYLLIMHHQGLEYHWKSGQQDRSDIHHLTWSRIYWGTSHIYVLFCLLCKRSEDARCGSVSPQTKINNINSTVSKHNYTPLSPPFSSKIQASFFWFGYLHLEIRMNMWHLPSLHWHLRKWRLWSCVLHPTPRHSTRRWWWNGRWCWRLMVKHKSYDPVTRYPWGEITPISRVK